METSEHSSNSPETTRAIGTNNDRREIFAGFPPDLEKASHSSSDSKFQSTKRFETDPESTSNTIPVSPPPDGGLLAWSQVFAGHLINAVTWGYITGFGVFQTHYTQTLGHTLSEISWIGGIQIFLLFLVGTLAGRGTDAGFGRHIVFGGSVLLVLGTFLTSLATKYWHVFLVQGVCIGIALGLIWLPSVTLIATYFVKKRTLAVTTAAAGTGTGSIIFPAIVQYLTPKLGFPWAVRCVGFVVLFFAIIFNLLLRTRLPPRKSGPLVDWGALREPPFVLYLIGVVLLYWIIYVPYFYIQVYGQDRLGFTDTQAVNLIFIINAVGMPTRPILGYVADRWTGPLNALIPSVFLTGISLYIWTAISTKSSLYGFVVIYGVFSAAAMGLFAATVPSLTKDLSKIGTRVGMVITLMSVAPLTGPAVAGALIQAENGKYLDTQVWGGTIVVAGAGFLLAARVFESGWKWRVKM